MGSFEKTLPFVEGSLLPYLFFLFSLLEQALWEPAVKVSPASLAKLKAVAVIVLVPLNCSALELVPCCSPSFLLISLLFSYSLSNFYLGQLPFCTIA